MVAALEVVALDTRDSGQVGRVCEQREEVGGRGDGCWRRSRGRGDLNDSRSRDHVRQCACRRSDDDDAASGVRVLEIVGCRRFVVSGRDGGAGTERLVAIGSGAACY